MRNLRSRWLVTWAVVSVAVAVLAFVAGRAVRSPWDEAAANARASLTVTAEVTERELVGPPPRVVGTVSLGREVVVGAPVPEGTDRPVVTAVGAEQGAELRSGELLAVVSGHPVIALELPFPLYRTIDRGSTGPDVEAVQEALAGLGLWEGRPSGTFDEDTATALEELYAREGVDPPVALGAAHVVALQEGPTTVASVAGVGSNLDDGAPLAVLRVGMAQLHARVGVADTESFELGSIHSARGWSGPEVEVEVASLGEFTTGGDDGALPGRDVTFSFRGPVTFVDGEELALEGTAPAPVRGTAVPLVALRDGPQGSHVLKMSDDAPVVVTVEVKGTGDGFAVVESDALAAGDLVVVSEP